MKKFTIEGELRNIASEVERARKRRRGLINIRKRTLEDSFTAAFKRAQELKDSYEDDSDLDAIEKCIQEKISDLQRVTRREEDALQKRAREIKRKQKGHRIMTIDLKTLLVVDEELPLEAFIENEGLTSWPHTSVADDLRRMEPKERKIINGMLVEKL